MLTLDDIHILFQRRGHEQYAGEAAAFIARPGAGEAVRLRLWDDAAKSPAMTTPPLDHFMVRARRCTLA